MTDLLGPLLNRGNTSDVYAWGADAVAKVLRPNVPAEWADREARSTQLIHAAGLAAPAVHDVVVVEGRPAIILERVNGPSMWDVMLAEPAEIPRLGGVLAELQREVHATRAPSDLPLAVDLMAEKIELAVGLEPGEREAVLGELGSLSAGTTLCHFDIHPNNVMLGPEGPVVIDWFDAAVGAPAADVVRASSLMWSDSMHGHLPASNPRAVDRAHEAFLSGAVSEGIPKDEFEAWERPVFAARLSEGLSDRTRAVVLAAVRDPSTSPFRQALA